MESMRRPGAEAVDREALLSWFRRSRKRTEQLFDLLAPEAYYTRPIPLRNPIVFYEGHIPAFSVNTLIKRGFGRDGVDPALERLFARGIDPADRSGVRNRGQEWPPRDDVRAYASAADTAIEAALAHDEIARSGQPVLDRAEGVYTLIEHEATHQETLLYIWHQVPYDQKIAPGDARPLTDGAPPAAATVRIPSGRVILGAERSQVPFGWDNEFPSLIVEVPEFALDVHNVTNQDFLEFVEGGGYDRGEFWGPEAWAWRVAADVRCPQFWRQRDGVWFYRGMFEELPLPPAWPVYVTHAEAEAYARWHGRRLPTEAEFHRAAFGTPSGEERLHPWGAAPPDGTQGNFDFHHWDPVPVGSYPEAGSAWGIQDLVGNGWEWTSTVFDGFPGFEAMASYPEYSADFFDGQHYVIKGASSATARELVRRSFRNWFRPGYPFVYAAFRCVH